ncbi:biotin transporter BioY [Candidatus Persebacteraceae bacterium Df01]|jgi:biotin transport system substrate-specific component|uniref:Biotin transporter n=1 Tax=Candidatus Doriopsillibacter californiensis TaxID=2970740 RepID=A0ABT7QMB7_9GAMM|nr:biotin transporter BioY [Candidatus Persebacteraceae bacterium Df01]
MNTRKSHLTIAQLLWPEVSTSSYSRAAILALTGSLLLTVSAKVQVPFYPIPVTMQTMIVMLLGMAYGSRLGVATVLLYLAEGAVGLPVFAGSPEKGIGLAYMLSGTGGYLIGFVLAAGICGRLAERGLDRTVYFVALVMFVGHVAIYVPGLLWLGTVIGWDKPILQLGLFPFIPGDILKLALAALSLPVAAKMARRFQSRGD